MMTITTTTASSNRDLEHAFRAEAAALGAPVDREREVRAVFDELRKAYAEDGSRAYHSLVHIADCLDLLDEVRATLEAPAEVAMAIWFHDAVYETQPLAASEEQSAALAKASCARMGIAAPAAERIAAMVRATKDHQLPGRGEGGRDGEGGGGDESTRGGEGEAVGVVREGDALTLFDIDLAILGADPVRYARYEAEIRAEYSWVPEDFFRAGRVKVLRSFLNRPAIYRTPRLRERLEAPARRNLEGAIAELSAETDALVLHATDDAIVVTRSAQLEALHAWSDLHRVSIIAGVDGAGPRLVLAFAPDDERGLEVALGATHASDIVERVRVVPGYDRDAEHRARTSAAPVVVYSREHHGRVAGPLRPLGGALGDRSKA